MGAVLYGEVTVAGNTVENVNEFAISAASYMMM